MDSLERLRADLTRRHFFSGCAAGLGVAALSSLLDRDARASEVEGARGSPHFTGRAKRVIFLFQSGAPSQIETFDHKPGLVARRGQELPDSIRRGQRVTGMTSSQKSFPVAPSIFPFARYGESGAWVSSLLPHTSGVVDDLCIQETTCDILDDPASTFP